MSLGAGKALSVVVNAASLNNVETGRRELQGIDIVDPGLM